MNQIIIKLIYRRNECLFTFASQVDLNVIKEIVKRHLSTTDSLWEDSRLHMIGMSGKDMDWHRASSLAEICEKEYLYFQMVNLAVNIRNNGQLLQINETNDTYLYEYHYEKKFYYLEYRKTFLTGLLPDLKDLIRLKKRKTRERMFIEV